MERFERLSSNSGYIPLQETPKYSVNDSELSALMDDAAKLLEIVAEHIPGQPELSQPNRFGEVDISTETDKSLARLTTFRGPIEYGYGQEVSFLLFQSSKNSSKSRSVWYRLSEVYSESWHDGMGTISAPIGKLVHKMINDFLTFHQNL